MGGAASSSDAGSTQCPGTAPLTSPRRSATCCTKPTDQAMPLVRKDARTLALYASEGFVEEGRLRKSVRIKPEGADGYDSLVVMSLHRLRADEDPLEFTGHGASLTVSKAQPCSRRCLDAPVACG